MTKTRLLARHLAREINSEEVEFVGGAKMGTKEKGETQSYVMLSKTYQNSGDEDGNLTYDHYWVDD